MKYYLIILISSFLISGCELPNRHTFVDKDLEISVNKTQNIRSVSPAEFKTLAATGEYVVLDIRTPAELLPKNGGKIFPEAINIDYYESDFKQRLAKLDKNQKYLIYCAVGGRSGTTLNIFENLGFLEVADLAGGKQAWDQFSSQD